jgi:hypothetical protein
MAILTAEKSPVAVFEDFGERTGKIIFVGTGGVRSDFAKSLDPTFSETAALYHGHKLEEVLNSDPDLLGNEFLAAGADPEYSEIAACFPPITSMRTHNFIGTHGSRDKVGFEYGGRTAHFDAAVYAPEIRAIRQQKKVWEGLVGGAEFRSYMQARGRKDFGLAVERPHRSPRPQEGVVILHMGRKRAPYRGECQVAVGLRVAGRFVLRLFLRGGGALGEHRWNCKQRNPPRTALPQKQEAFHIPPSDDKTEQPSCRIAW